MRDCNNIINKINNEKSFILSENLFKYCKLKKYEKICEFMIKENYHLISICDDLVSLKNQKSENELEYYIHQVLYEKDLLNYKNEKNVTIFHILAKIRKDLSFYIENKIDKYKLSNLFDDFGNTPIYYACQKLNINFIETFSNYSFSSNNNDQQNVNYTLFNETNNKTSPLKSLYFQINQKDNKILKLIIDISVNEKKVYILNIMLFLFKNYKNNYKDYFNLPYKDNMNNEDYLIKIIGLYTYYTKELNGNFSKEEFQDNSPIFNCFNSKNFDFLFDILLKEKNINVNEIDKEGKNLLHLIVEMKEDSKKSSLNKKDIIFKALEAGIDYNSKDNNGNTPLFYAKKNEDNDAIKILINKNINNE